MGEDMTGEQKRYLEGFASGINIGRISTGFPGAGGGAKAAPPEPAGPDASRLLATARDTVERWGRGRSRHATTVRALVRTGTRC